MSLRDIVAIRKLYHPETLKYCLELAIGQRWFIKLTPFWFVDYSGRGDYL